jgi:CheY-like chemotaxis protein
MAAATVANKCRTLVVEDDRSSCDALTKLLARFGYPVECATTLQRAMDLLSWNPGCILLDLMLPDGNGIDLIQKLRDENLPIKVAVMTAVSDPDLLRKVRDLAPEALFQKPVNFVQVIRWLDESAG